MPTKYEVRQLVSCVRRRWLEVIYEGGIERLVRMEYDRCKVAHPDAYFELVRVTHDEECLDFTPMRDEAPNEQDKARP